MKPENRTKTKLASHVWDLKDRGVDLIESWRILDRAPSYNPVTKKCHLCLKEKFHTMYSIQSSTLKIEIHVIPEDCNFCSYMKQAGRIASGI